MTWLKKKRKKTEEYLKKLVIAISLRSDSSRVLHGISAEKDKF